MKNIRNMQIFKTFYCKMYSTKQVKWDIMAGICLLRKPVISKTLSNLEVNYQNILQEIENEKSLKSDHELRHEKDVQRMEKLKNGTVTDFDDLDQGFNQTAQDYLDKNKEEISKFVLANRITNADCNNDKKSLNRKLDENLILVIKQQLGNKDFWIFPQGLWSNGETLKETAKRILKDSCGNNINVKFYGNAPCGFYKYKYPKEKREKFDVEGAKVFFYKATFLDGNIEKKGTWTDYEWTTFPELNNKLIEPYMKNIKLFLTNYNM